MNPSLAAPVETPLGAWLRGLSADGASAAFYLSDLYLYFWAMTFLFAAFFVGEMILLRLHVPWYFSKGHEMAAWTRKLAHPGDLLRPLFEPRAILTRSFKIRTREDPAQAFARPRFDLISPHGYFIRIDLAPDDPDGGTLLNLRVASPFFLYPTLVSAILGWTVGAIEPIVDAPIYGMLAEVPAIFLLVVLLAWHRLQRRTIEGGCRQVLATIGLPEEAFSISGGGRP